MHQKNSIMALAALAAPASAYLGVVSVPAKRTRTTSTALPALIYGWDGEQETTDTSTSSNGNSYFEFASDVGESCTPEGLAMAETLSYDTDRAGHLARLAVAFSPPERALTLGDIETVQVICVHGDKIDIQAILCEDGGCVSLSVPVLFPNACFFPNAPNQLEGCVLQNLDELDAKAGNLLLVQEQTTAVQSRLGEVDELCQLDEEFDAFPSWWIPPECYQQLAPHCETVRQILNEEEFQPDVVALAQDALRKIHDGQTYRVLQAKVAIVGPAGMCFKVRAQNDYGQFRILDVVHPFDQPLYDVTSLRAAVLGAVAAA